MSAARKLSKLLPRGPVRGGRAIPGGEAPQGNLTRVAFQIALLEQDNQRPSHSQSKNVYSNFPPRSVLHWGPKLDLPCPIARFRRLAAWRLWMKAIQLAVFGPASNNSQNHGSPFQSLFQQDARSCFVSSGLLGWFLGGVSSSSLFFPFEGGAPRFLWGGRRSSSPTAMAEEDARESALLRPEEHESFRRCFRFPAVSQRWNHLSAWDHSGFVPISVIQS